MQQHTIHIGTSGWSYKHWRGTFYPENIKVKDHFQYYQERFNTVEINNTFYHLPKKETFTKWKTQVTDDFVYIIKASRYITHMKKLHDPEESASLFLGHAKLLGKKLGAILFQLPPTMKADVELLEKFIAQLPKVHRYVFEFRHASWYDAAVFRILEKNNCAFCIYELDGHQSPVIATADFVYIRLHGPGKKYQGSYSDAALKSWAALCKDWVESKDVFLYFDNDEKGYAAFNALKLKELAEQ